METKEKIIEFKCMNCSKRKLCRYCPAKFDLETHNYCNHSNLIMNTFENKFIFKTSYKN